MNIELSDELRNILILHLQDLKTNFMDYFPLPDSSKIWIRDPFGVDVHTIKGLTSLEENFTCATIQATRLLNELSLHFFYT